MKIEHAEGRIFAKTEHGEAEVLYRIQGTIMHVYRSYVPDEDRGRGIAKKLNLAAFEFAENNGLKVSPDCSYTKGFLEKHKELRRFSVV